MEINFTKAEKIYDHQSLDNKKMRSRFANRIFLAIVFVISCHYSHAIDRPSHLRPYFVPQSEKARILDLVSREIWAKTEFQRIKKLAETDGYQAVFPYALVGKDEHLAVARV